MTFSAGRFRAVVPDKAALHAQHFGRSPPASWMYARFVGRNGPPSLAFGFWFIRLQISGAKQSTDQIHGAGLASNVGHGKMDHVAVLNATLLLDFAHDLARFSIHWIRFFYLSSHRRVRIR
jgi:hypothetical protein